MPGPALPAYASLRAPGGTLLTAGATPLSPQRARSAAGLGHHTMALAPDLPGHPYVQYRPRGQDRTGDAAEHQGKGRPGSCQREQYGNHGLNQCHGNDDHCAHGCRTHRIRQPEAACRLLHPQRPGPYPPALFCRPVGVRRLLLRCTGRALAHCLLPRGHDTAVAGLRVLRPGHARHPCPAIRVHRPDRRDVPRGLAPPRCVPQRVTPHRRQTARTRAGAPALPWMPDSRRSNAARARKHGSCCRFRPHLPQRGRTERRKDSLRRKNPANR